MSDDIVITINAKAEPSVIAERLRREICRSYDLPVYLVCGGRRPRFFRLRWALRRLTGFSGERSRARRHYYKHLGD